MEIRNFDGDSIHDIIAAFESDPESIDFCREYGKWEKPFGEFFIGEDYSPHWYRISSRHGSERVELRLNLRDAIAACDRLEMASYTNCARLVLGQVLGGMDGETMRAEAALWLQECGVRNPAAMAALHAPAYFEQ